MPHKILRIDASVKADDSVSRKLTDRIIDKLLATYPDAAITHRDLGRTPLHQIDGDWIAAVFTPAEDRSPAQAEIAAQSDQLIAEVKEADTLVIGLPIYNFAPPAQLKTWLDQLARAGETFRYTEDGPIGLVTNTRAIIAYSSNGTRMSSDIDFASGYVRHMLGFFGITDVQFVASDHMAIDADSSMKSATDGIDQLTLAA